MRTITTRSRSATGGLPYEPAHRHNRARSTLTAYAVAIRARTLRVAVLHGLTGPRDVLWDVFPAPRAYSVFTVFRWEGGLGSSAARSWLGLSHLRRRRARRAAAPGSRG